MKRYYPKLDLIHVDEHGAYMLFYDAIDLDKEPVKVYADNCQKGGFLYTLLTKKYILYIIRKCYRRSK